MLFALYVVQALMLIVAPGGLFVWSWTEIVETRRSEENYRREHARTRRQLIALIGEKEARELMDEPSA